MFSTFRNYFFLLCVVITAVLKQQTVLIHREECSFQSLDGVVGAGQ